MEEGKQLHIHRAEVISLSGRKPRLSRGEAIPIDDLVYATGWQRSPASRLFSLDKCITLGVPAPLSSQPPDLAAHWDCKDREADREIRARFPILADPPQHRFSTAETTPYRLYRHIVSPNLIANNDRSIAFLNLAGSAHTVTYAELSALWAVSWMGGFHTPMSAGTLSNAGRVEAEDELDREVALVNAFLRHRYLSSAKRPPAFILETQKVFDTLVQDMKLNPYRRRKDGGLFGVFKEYLMPHECGDYAWILDDMVINGRRLK